MSTVHGVIGLGVGVVGGAALAWLAATGAPTDAECGRQEVVEAGGPTHRAQVRRRAPDGTAAPEAEQSVEALQARVAMLEDALAEARFSGALAKGQLATHTGDPIPWDPDLPAAFHAEAVERAIAEAFGEDSEIAVAEVDCSEFPCLVALQAPSGAEQPDQLLQEAAGAFVKDAFGEGTSMGMAITGFKNGEDDPGTHVGTFWAVPDGHQGPELMRRAGYRAENIARSIEEGA